MRADSDVDGRKRFSEKRDIDVPTGEVVSPDELTMKGHRGRDQWVSKGGSQNDRPVVRNACETLAVEITHDLGS